MPVNVNKTILDVLLEKNRLSPADTLEFDKNLTNAQIEEKLRAKKMVSEEDIAKSYAVIFDLPFIRLQNYDIDQEVFKIIPIELAKKYQTVAFDHGFGSKVKIAVAKPAELKSNPPEILSQISKDKGVNIDLYITTVTDVNFVIDKMQQIPLKDEQNDRKEDHEPEAPQVTPPQPVIEHATQIRPQTLKTVDLKSLKISYDIISKFPIEISRKYKMVVFDQDDEVTKVAVSDPYDKKVMEILEFVRDKNQIKIEEFVASPAEIEEAIKLYYKKPEVPKEKPQEVTPEVVTPVLQKPQYVAAPVNYKAAQMQPLAQKPKFNPRPDEPDQQLPQSAVDEETLGQQVLPETDLDKFLGKEIKDIEGLKEIAQTGNVPNILAATVALAVLKKASDIHIEPGNKSLRIRYRVDGVLRDVIFMPEELLPALISRIKILSRLKIDEQRIPQDGRFDALTHGHQIDVRVSTLPTVKGEKSVMRILDKTQNIYSFEELGLVGRNLKILQENISKPFGVILSTGPTGSGKSTTLYAILKKISSPEVNVITLEDPVEYELPGINQCQVKPKIGFSFAEGLRSVLRQDPNIIMVGEIRDAETASMATHAALTGHLVLSTLHTNDAAGCLPRLTNMGIEPFLITSSINCIIGQRLVRKLCDKCKKEMQLPPEMAQEVEKQLGHFNLEKPYKFYQSVGCSECTNGFSGRIGIFEVLPMTDKIETLAIQKRPASEINAAAIEEGMITMKQDGLMKAAKGLTTISEVMRVTSSG